MNPIPFDNDFSRVTREHYITGKSAINFHVGDETTGGWHRLGYFDRGAGLLRLSLAGFHYPGTSGFFGNVGIFDAAPALARYGWAVNGEIWMADHFRAAADMVIRWALSESQHCSVEISDWFPSGEDRQRFLDLLETSNARLRELGKLERVERWLEGQT